MPQAQSRPGRAPKNGSHVITVPGPLAPTEIGAARSRRVGNIFPRKGNSFPPARLGP